MSLNPQSTGYGPSARSGRLMFNGDERKYELWEVKFLGYLQLQKLHAVILPPEEGGHVDASLNDKKNADAFAELIQCLDDHSLSLVMRDAKNNGRNALKILGEHYLSKGKPRVISLYTELTSLKKTGAESVTDYIIRAETAATSLKTSGETISDSLLIAMVLKGFPPDFKSFTTVVTQKDKTLSFSEFKVALQSFEETERTDESDNVMRLGAAKPNGRGSTGPKSSVIIIIIICSSYIALFLAEASSKCFTYLLSLADLLYPSPVICYARGKPGHWATDSECRAPKNTTGRRRWCHICRNHTHDTAWCRKKKNAANLSQWRLQRTIILLYSKLVLVHVVLTFLCQKC